MFYKTETISILANSNFSGLSNYYNKNETGATVSKVNFNNNHYTKAEIDDIGNGLPTLILNPYTKTEADNLLYTTYPSLSCIADNFYAKTEIDSTLNAYTTSTQLHTDVYKVKTILTLDTYTTTTQLYNGLYSKGYINQLLVQPTTLFEFY